MAAKAVLGYTNLEPKPKAGPVSLSMPILRQNVAGFLTPPEIYQTVVMMGAEKAVEPWWKILWLGVLAGIYLSFAGALSEFVGGQMPQIAEENPGLDNFVKGFIGLPFGLALIVICGAELYTSNCAFMPAAFYEGRCTIIQLLKVWFWSFWGNLAGSLFMVWILDETYLIVPGGKGPINSKVPTQISIQKTTEDWGAAVCRGFLCNYLVCLAVWQATAAQDICGKILGILFPVGAFVSIQFDHTVANMFWIPYGMKLGSGVTVRNYVARSMVPVLIGNTISAAFFLAGGYALVYGTLPQRISNFLGGMGRQKVVQTGYEDSAHGHKLPNGSKPGTQRVPGDNIL